MSRAPSLTLIAAVAANGVIGRDGDLPWRLPDDLKRFRQLTVGHTVLMGRKTWDSLGRPLPERDNWVLSRAPGFAPAGARVFASLDTALAAAPGSGLIVIGGAELYRQTLALADRIELTEVDAEVHGDARFPALDPVQWERLVVEPHPADARHAHAFRFVRLRRREAPAVSSRHPT